MKRNLAIVASLLGLGVTSLAPSSKATDMFDVTASSPGVVVFSGSGTAQFNNSLGTNNSFQVGSSTNLGVNGSVSSTTGYDVSSVSDLTLSGQTTLNQVIGTSGTAQSRVNTKAHESARSAMSSWESSYGASYTADNSYGWNSQAEYQRAWDAEYERKYSTAVTNTTASESSSASDGTISGSFRTIEAGTARSSGSASDWDSDATTAASASWGADYASWTGDKTATSESQWQAEYDRSYNSAYASASAASNRYSDSTVNVQGIGSDASVVAKEDSSFLVDIGANTSTVTSSTSTANGSAGASLATSSFANQSSSSTASGFLQAFGGSVASQSNQAPVGGT